MLSWRLQRHSHAQQMVSSQTAVPFYQTTVHRRSCDLWGDHLYYRSYQFLLLELLFVHRLNLHSALIGQLTHAWASTANSNRAAVLNQIFHAKLSTKCKINAKVWHGDIVWCHKVTEVKLPSVCKSLTGAFLSNKSCYAVKSEKVILLHISNTDVIGDFFFFF